MASHRTRSTSLLSYLAVAGAAMLVAMVMNRRGQSQYAGQSRLGRSDEAPNPSRPTGSLAAISPRAAAEAEGLDDCGFVRPAGRGAMRDPPRRWDKVDEEVDESFPASDPPGNY